MHGEEDWGRGCRELGRQQPCPESFAAGEAPQPAGGRRQGKRAGDTALALGPPPRARAAPPRPRRAPSAEFRAPRCGPCLSCRPPASFSLQRSPRPSEAPPRRPRRTRNPEGRAEPRRDGCWPSRKAAEPSDATAAAGPRSGAR